MKKFPVLLFVPLALFSCGSKVPKEINDFLSKAILTKPETVKSGTFTQVLNEKIAGEDGTANIDFTFYRKDDLNFGLKAIYTLTGTRIVEEEGVKVSKKIIELTRTDKDVDKPFSLTKTVNDGSPVEELINQQSAWSDYYYKIFDAGGNVYRSNGLFYGDVLSVKANQFYPFYTLNEDKTQLTFEEKGSEYEKGFAVDQTLVIDDKGMLTSLIQYARIVESADINFTNVTQTGSYVYNN